jgi:hypothetical protein
VTYLIEYLGEFELIFETVLGYVSGNQMGCFEAKKKESKISCLGTFKRRALVFAAFRREMPYFAATRSATQERFPPLC